MGGAETLTSFMIKEDLCFLNKLVVQELLKRNLETMTKEGSPNLDLQEIGVQRSKNLILPTDKILINQILISFNLDKIQLLIKKLYKTKYI